MQSNQSLHCQHVTYTEFRQSKMRPYKALINLQKWRITCCTALKTGFPIIWLILIFSFSSSLPPLDNSKYKDMMSPLIDTNQLMDYVDGCCDQDPRPSQTVEIHPRSASIYPIYGRSQSPMLIGDNNNNNSGTKSRRSSTSNSPKRILEDEDCGNKSPQHVPCITDIGTIVRRVRNVRIGFPSETRVFAYTTETCV